jgi:UDP-N-acetylglucosamine--N-acetylmuramyl-(pentapeptide) pyrophosphoryl-undecaprenol N-acetylglucosamine transferase
LLSKKCDAVLLGFGEAERHIKGAKRIYTVGNPVRDAFRATSREDARRALGISPSELFILSFGGSLGAERLNEAVLGWFEHADGKRYRLTHVHATGRRHFAELEKRRGVQKNASPLRIVPYVDNMPLWLSAADLAITRSGAITVSELCRSATPAILIPSPNVTDNHQYKNAMHAERVGFATVIEESELTEELLYTSINALISHREKLNSMALAARNSFKSDTEEVITALVKEVTEKQ